MSEMKNMLDGIRRRLDIIKEKISELEDITVDTVQNEIRKRLKRWQIHSKLIL